MVSLAGLSEARLAAAFRSDPEKQSGRGRYLRSAEEHSKLTCVLQAAAKSQWKTWSVAGETELNKHLLKQKKHTVSLIFINNSTTITTTTTNNNNDE